MKISPTAIRQKAFETSFRGFEKKQVTDFLEEMSVIMEQINQENLDLRSKLQQVESEAKRLKDVEDSLFRTLKTAEDTGASIITEAAEAADQIILEANSIAEQTTKAADRYAQQVKKQADDQARIITSAAEAKAKDTIKEIRESMQSLVRSYDGLLDQREALVKSLKRLSQDALNQIDLSDAHFFRIDGKAYTRAVEELSRSTHYTVANIAALGTSAIPAVMPEPEARWEEDGGSTATLEADTQEAINAFEHELEEEGDLEVSEQAMPVPVMEEEPLTSVQELEDQEVIKEEIPVQAPVQIPVETRFSSEEQRPEDPKKSSGSFFDQFD